MSRRRAGTAAGSCCSVRDRAGVVALAVAGCVLGLAAPAAADVGLGTGGGGLESDTTAGAFDAVHLSASLPAPELAIDAPATAAAGSFVPVTVRVGGVKASDEILVLELSDGTGWKAITSAAADDHGVAALGVAMPDEGRYRYRARMAATTKHRAVAGEFWVDVTTTDPSSEGTTASSMESTVDRPPSPPLCGGEVELRPDGTPWVGTYSDEFDGDTLDRRWWVPQVSATSGFFSGTPTHPACVVDDPRTIAVREGTLVLSALVLDEPVSCGRKSSALLSGSVTHHGTFAQTYGRYEVRAKLPSYQGKGLQETFWLWPNDPYRYGVEHPASGEIDFGEFYSNHPDLNVAVMHYVFDPGTISYATNTNIYTSHWCKIRPGEFNTYLLEWQPGRMTISVNDTVCIVNNYRATNAAEANPAAPFDRPFFLSLSQLFGTTGNEFDPATGPRQASTEVDWVRVWA